METDASQGCQESIARIAGAIAHELNNPLQGVLSLVTVCKEESDSGNRQRLELIHRGLLRLTQIVESLSAVYENLPRPAGQMTVGGFLDLLTESFAERKIGADIASSTPSDLSIYVMVPELVRLIREVFSVRPPTDGRVQIRMEFVEGRAVLTCERQPSGTAEPWCGLSGHHVCSGLAVLIDEMTRLAGGEPGFRFDQASLSGIRLCFRTRMN